MYILDNKRKMAEVQVVAKKKRNGPQNKVDLNGSHVIVKIDVSDEDMKSIIVPEPMNDEIKSVISKMGSAKVQFGVDAEFKNAENVTKSWYVSNSAIIYTDEFINNGTLKLMEKLGNYTELSSGWSLLRILEISMVMTKFHEIINLTGIALLIIQLFI